MKPKVLITDDSALMRRHLCALLNPVSEEPNFEIQTANNGAECLRLIETFQPDAVALDINMPVMDGIECLKNIVAKFPNVPVVMVSSLTEKGAQATFEALSIGAIDYVQKPSGTFSYNLKHSAPEFIAKIKNAVQVKQSAKIKKLSSHKLVLEPSKRKDSLTDKHGLYVTPVAQRYDLVVIGVSTGGPTCLQTILTELPHDFPTPIVVAQHMPARFTKVFAERLNSICKLKVLEIDRECRLAPGTVYIAKGDADIEISSRGQVRSLEPTQTSYWHPSVTKLVESAMLHFNPKKLCCIQLTGMGNDGAEAMARAHSKGATTVAESEETTVVFGMPGELVKLNGATKVLPNYDIAKFLTS